MSFVTSFFGIIKSGLYFKNFTFKIQLTIQEWNKIEPKALIPGQISHNRLTNIVANVRDIGVGEHHKAEALFYRDTGLLTIYGVSDELALDEHMKYCQFALTNMGHALTEEELERAKKELKMKLFADRNGTLATSNALGEQVRKLYVEK